MTSGGRFGRKDAWTALALVLAVGWFFAPLLLGQAIVAEPDALAALLPLLPDRTAGLDAATARGLIDQAVASAGVRKGVLMKSLRAALLGKLQGPDLVDTWLLLHPLGEDRSRIEASLAS